MAGQVEDVQNGNRSWIANVDESECVLIPTAELGFLVRAEITFADQLMLYLHILS